MYHQNNHNKIGFLCYLLVYIFIINSCADNKITNIASVGKDIICFGDSITEGIGALRGEDYPSVLSELLKREVINAGHGGDTTSTALQRLEREVLSKDPLLVIIILGGNDALLAVDKDTTFNNLRNMIRRIQERGAIVALGELGPFTMDNYKKCYRQIAREEGAVLIPDIFSGIFGHSEYMSDAIHPNRQGYQRLAKKVYDVILPVLEKNRQLRSRL